MVYVYVVDDKNVQRKININKRLMGKLMKMPSVETTLVQVNEIPSFALNRTEGNSKPPSKCMCRNCTGKNKVLDEQSQIIAHKYRVISKNFYTLGSLLNEKSTVRRRHNPYCLRPAFSYLLSLIAGMPNDPQPAELVMTCAEHSLVSGQDDEEFLQVVRPENPSNQLRETFMSMHANFKDLGYVIKNYFGTVHDVVSPLHCDNVDNSKDEELSKTYI